MSGWKSIRKWPFELFSYWQTSAPESGVPLIKGKRRSRNATTSASADSLGSRIAAQYQGATSQLQASSILYLGAILMVISLVTNVIAQAIVSRFERSRRAY